MKKTAKNIFVICLMLLCFVIQGCSVANIVDKDRLDNEKVEKNQPAELTAEQISDSSITIEVPANDITLVANYQAIGS